jgi:hypothetical protein
MNEKLEVPENSPRAVKSTACFKVLKFKVLKLKSDKVLRTLKVY